jgi:hypothetical protein
MLWEQPKALVDAGEVLNSRTVRRTVSLRWADCQYVLKHYMEPNFIHALKHSLLPSRAWQAWTSIHTLADAGIATPRAVACVEDQGGRLRKDSYLMYPYIEGQTLTSYFKQQETVPAPHAVWNQLQRLWQSLRPLQVSLADTNVRNFILCPDGRLWVIDLDTTRFHRSAWITAHYHRRSWKRLLYTAQIAQSKAA